MFFHLFLTSPMTLEKVETIKLSRRRAVCAGFRRGASAPPAERREGFSL